MIYKGARMPSNIRRHIARSYAEKTIVVTNENIKEVVLSEIERLGAKADLNHIDVSNVTVMAGLFERMDFYGDISRWDVSNVVDMSSMFYNSSFNGDISKWDVKNVVDMDYMFSESNFDGDLSKWDVRRVDFMRGMFKDSPFNGDISKWIDSFNRDERGMFDGSPLASNPPVWYKGSATNRRSVNSNKRRVVSQSELVDSTLDSVSEFIGSYTGRAYKAVGKLASKLQNMNKRYMHLKLDDVSRIASDENAFEVFSNDYYEQFVEQLDGLNVKLGRVGSTSGITLETYNASIVYEGGSYYVYVGDDVRMLGSFKIGEDRIVAVDLGEDEDDYKSQGYDFSFFYDADAVKDYFTDLLNHFDISEDEFSANVSVDRIKDSLDLVIGEYTLPSIEALSKALDILETMMSNSVDAYREFAEANGYATSRKVVSYKTLLQKAKQAFLSTRKARMAVSSSGKPYYIFSFDYDLDGDGDFDSDVGDYYASVNKEIERRMFKAGYDVHSNQSFSREAQEPITSASLESELKTIASSLGGFVDGKSVVVENDLGLSLEPYSLVFVGRLGYTDRVGSRADNRILLQKAKQAFLNGRKSSKARSSQEDTIVATDDTLWDIVRSEFNRLGDKANLNHIDVSQVTDFSGLFRGRLGYVGIRRFNGDISQWDVSNAEDMTGMFMDSHFNGNISNWDVKPSCIVHVMFKNCPLESHPPAWYKDSATNRRKVNQRALKVFSNLANKKQFK